LKDRELGEATGLTVQLRYDHDTGRMVEFHEDYDDDVDPDELF
jgi:hypothetical protein